jgi:hypothetical protein
MLGMLNKSTEISEDELFENANYNCGSSGVYFLLRAGKVVYVGQAKNIPSRIEAHTGNKLFNSFSFFFCHPSECDFFESFYIYKFAPEYNGGELNSKGYLVAPMKKSEVQERLLSGDYWREQRRPRRPTAWERFA